MLQRGHSVKNEVAFSEFNRLQMLHSYLNVLESQPSQNEVDCYTTLFILANNATQNTRYLG